MSENNSRTLIRITSKKQAQLLNLAELWRYRDLLELIVRRDIAVKYRQTILGPLWLVIQPLALSVVFSGVFGAVGGFPTGDVPRPVFYLVGLVPWAYFSQVFAQVAGSLHANIHLFSKVYFPRLIIPGASLLSGLVGLAIQMICCALVMLGYAATQSSLPVPGWQSLFLLPFAIILLMTFTFGLGLWMAVLTARYRDLAQVTPFLVQILMYVTPLLYPLASVPERFRLVASLNPLSVVLEAFRLAAFGSGALSIGTCLLAIVVAGAILLSGLRAFSIVEQNIVDAI